MRAQQMFLYLFLTTNMMPTADAQFVGHATISRIVSEPRIVRSSHRTLPTVLRSQANTVRFIAPGYLVGPNIAPTTTLPAAEEHIAMDPNNPHALVAAISDFSLRGGFNTTKYALSLDNGATWIDRFVPTTARRFPVSGDGVAWEANSDPVVAIDTQGNVYLSHLYFNSTSNANGLYVNVSSLASAVKFTGAQTFPVATNLDPATILFVDKPWITVDNSRAATNGTVYLSWTSLITDSDGNPVSSTIVVSRSVDHGNTWSAPLRVSSPELDGGVQGSQVAVGPGGEVHVSYEACCFFNPTANDFVSGRLFLNTSLDSGLTFSAATPVTPLFNDISFFFMPPYRVNSFPAMSVSPRTGNVVFAYSDFPNTTVGPEVEFVRCSVLGITPACTSPLVLNDVAIGAQFMPAITVDEAGIIHTSWFDTRNGAGNPSRYDYYATYSTDNGASFRVNARVSATTIDSDGLTFNGDYTGITAGAGFAHPVWTNHRLNGGTLQTSTLTVQ